MTYYLSRAWCRIFGHRWTRTRWGSEVCTRDACRGRNDAERAAR